MVSGWRCAIQILFPGTSFFSLAAAATAVADTGTPLARSDGASAVMTDFLSLELVVLVGVVLLALVLIARSGKAP
jgi:hypothetical protein